MDDCYVFTALVLWIGAQLCTVICKSAWANIFIQHPTNSILPSLVIESNDNKSELEICRLFKAILGCNSSFICAALGLRVGSTCITKTVDNNENIGTTRDLKGSTEA